MKLNQGSKASLLEVALYPSNRPHDARMALPVHTVMTRSELFTNFPDHRQGSQDLAKTSGLKPGTGTQQNVLQTG